MRLAQLLLASCAVATATATATAPCDERRLERDAVVVLAAHVDVELGGVGAGKRDVVGFQYLKPADALLAAQALAHEDFDQAAAQVQRILQYQKPDGLLPHLVYGPSVPSDWHWIPSNRTFHPGPAFWQTAALADQQQEEQEAPSSPLNTSTISAPPVAADVAWEIFRLAPYDSVLGVRTTAVQFLCRVYEPLKKLQKHLFFTRRGPAPSSLLAARHPWETFSSLSPHWKAFLAELKNAPDYETVISSIPKEARTRFADGARSILLAEDAVENLYEPMIYLAAQQRSGGSSDIYTRESTVFDSITEAGNSAAAQFGVEDVEFNALALRSSLGLVNIGRVLLEHSSVCTGFALTQKELLHDMEELQSMAKGLEGALIGNNNTQVHSLRGFLPGYAAELDDDKKMLSMKHFLSEPARGFSTTISCSEGLLGTSSQVWPTTFATKQETCDPTT
ncbi:RxLR-like protein [Phytophthora cinnamomi]|uniref:RxLR-like protein n=1 Tax=Phytophthora cinnamomi TaxID=4785 RepID=UPI00355AAA57|nr:RxLR-like protein [Phytophthora cinnamomi]